MATRNFRSHGFTLIELMVTVAIVAILAALAYPNYRNYVLRGQIVEATNGLSTMRADMERYFQDNRTYAAVGTTIKPPCATSTKVGTFTFSCTSDPTATTFTLQAVGSGSTAGFTYKVDQTGGQSTTITGVKGWNGCSTAWITKAGQTC